MTVDESALEGLDLAPVYSQTPTYGNDWTFSGTEPPTGYHWKCEWHYNIGEFLLFKVSNTDPSDATNIYDAGPDPDLISVRFENGIIDVTATRVRTDIIGYTHRATLYKYEGDTEWRTASITGTMDCQALVAAGLMPEGAGTEVPPIWIT